MTLAASPLDDMSTTPHLYCLRCKVDSPVFRAGPPVGPCRACLENDHIGMSAEIEVLKVQVAAATESRRLILELACSELGLCADAFHACFSAREALRQIPCLCGTAARNVRAVIGRLREQVRT